MALLYSARDSGGRRASGEHSASSPNGAGIGSDACGEDIDWSLGLRGLPRRSNPKNAQITGSVLAKVIEGEIIPKLFLAHRNPPGPETAAAPLPVRQLDTDSFARLVLDAEPEEIVGEIEALIESGIPIERIYTDMLAPVARKLGVFWEEDRCTFTDVTLGLARMHQVLHEVGRRLGLENGPGGQQKRRIYLTAVPGEQHTFGVAMLEEFFLHAGWEAAINYASDPTEIARFAAAENIDVIGFSIGCHERLESLNKLIDLTRKASRNRNVAILTGGRVFLDHPKLAASVDGATVVADGVRAVAVAADLVSNTGTTGAARLM